MEIQKEELVFLVELNRSTRVGIGHQEMAVIVIHEIVFHDPVVLKFRESLQFRHQLLYRILLEDAIDHKDGSEKRQDNLSFEAVHSLSIVDVQIDETSLDLAQTQVIDC